MSARAKARPNPMPFTSGASGDVAYVARQWHVDDEDWTVIRTAVEAWWQTAALALRDGVHVTEAVARGCDAAQDAVWPQPHLGQVAR